MKAVTVVCHLETGRETEVTWTNRLWLHRGVVSSYQWVSSRSHGRSQMWLGHSRRLDELCMQHVSSASESVKEISPTCITTAQSRGSSQEWGRSGVACSALCQKISHDWWVCGHRSCCDILWVTSVWADPVLAILGSLSNTFLSLAGQAA